ncbi:Gti1/Pac2 family-domain-containing protein [Paraphysoderma sedebokerense]|nr:Gti1/Pac2 family-domain-containing protein [Paraphysoderma sedebokerense]
MESFYGLVDTLYDALLLVEAARIGVIPRVMSRMTRGIKPGSIFVYQEEESGIKRWTDGRSWCSARVYGSFLYYKETEPRTRKKKRPSTSEGAEGLADDQSGVSASTESSGTTGSSKLKTDGLIKKCISVETRDNMQPSSSPLFANIKIPKGMYPKAESQLKIFNINDPNLLMSPPNTPPQLDPLGQFFPGSNYNAFNGGQFSSSSLSGLGQVPGVSPQLSNQFSHNLSPHSHLTVPTRRFSSAEQILYRNTSNQYLGTNSVPSAQQLPVPNQFNNNISGGNTDTQSSVSSLLPNTSTAYSALDIPTLQFNDEEPPVVPSHRFHPYSPSTRNIRSGSLDANVHRASSWPNLYPNTSVSPSDQFQPDYSSLTLNTTSAADAQLTDPNSQYTGYSSLQNPLGQYSPQPQEYNHTQQNLNQFNQFNPSNPLAQTSPLDANRIPE